MQKFDGDSMLPAAKNNGFPAAAVLFFARVIWPDVRWDKHTPARAVGCGEWGHVSRWWRQGGLRVSCWRPAVRCVQDCLHARRDGWCKREVQCCIAFCVAHLGHIGHLNGIDDRMLSLIVDD